MQLVTPQGATLSQLDDRDPSPRSGEILLLSCVRDEALRLEHFQDHYRALGVDRFLVVDNDSGDGTTDYLLRQPDTHVFHTTASYADSLCGVHWINALAGRLASGHWIVLADADELLVYPQCEQEGLAGLAARLDSKHRTGLLAFMLDMYGDGAIRDTDYEAGKPFLDSCPYFDSDSYTYRLRGYRRRVPAFGGARERLFWGWRTGSGSGSPYLPKVPLVRWSSKMALAASTHVISGARLGPMTGALLHFKLFSDFVENVEREVARSEHWNDAAEYSRYAEGLAANPGLGAMYDGSERYSGSDQLVELGLVRSR